VKQPLAGLTVVVTRPERQAGRFIQLLREAGAAIVAFPTIAIEPVTLDAASRARLVPDDYDWVIYTSTNAVEQGLAQLPRPLKARIAVVGRATARALREQGLEVHATPEDVSNSEGLLAAPELADVRGHHILILKGVGGRDTLRETLSRRGASVTLGEVYSRTIAVPAPGTLDGLQRACAKGVAVVAVTSVDVLDALLQLAPETLVARLLDTPLLVPGERVAAAARERAWRGPLVVAPSAEDATMIDALARAREEGGIPLPA
jgi:uroporphyrinogen-III synthase